jgi:hypothetical protein
MFTVTRYCAQEFLSTSAGIQAGEVREFREKADAMRAGRQLGGRRVGALVYQVTGEPPSNLWRQPELIEVVGYVPQAALDLLRSPSSQSVVQVVSLEAERARRAG